LRLRLHWHEWRLWWLCLPRPKWRLRWLCLSRHESGWWRRLSRPEWRRWWLRLPGPKWRWRWLRLPWPKWRWWWLRQSRRKRRFPRLSRLNRQPLPPRDRWHGRPRRGGCAAYAPPDALERLLAVERLPIREDLDSARLAPDARGEERFELADARPRGDLDAVAGDLDEVDVPACARAKAVAILLGERGERGPSVEDLARRERELAPRKEGLQTADRLVLEDRKAPRRAALERGYGDPHASDDDDFARRRERGERRAGLDGAAVRGLKEERARGEREDLRGLFARVIRRIRRPEGHGLTLLSLMQQERELDLPKIGNDLDNIGSERLLRE
jgi:hypothetical protein